MPGLSSVALVTCSAALVCGMMLVLLGSLRPALAERLGIGETRVGGLVSALNLALIPMMLLSGLLIDSLGVRWVLLVGSLALAVGVFSFTVGRSYQAALGSVLLVGAALACVNAACVVLMPVAFGLGAGHEVATLNLGHAFLAMGSLLLPPLGEVLLRRAGFERTVAVLALVCLAPAALAAVSFRTAAGAEFALAGQRADLEEVLRSPYLWVLGLAFLLYTPLEFALSTWGLSFLGDTLKLSERRAARLMSLFWLAFLASRLAMAFAWHTGGMSSGWAAVLEMVLAGTAVVALANLGGAAAGGRGAPWIWIALGALLGPIFPTLVALAIKEFPLNRGTAYGMVFAIGSLGGLVLAPLVGMVVRRGGVSRMLRVLAPLAILLVVAMLAAGLMKAGR